jgi:hypothetical protein
MHVGIYSNLFLLEPLFRQAQVVANTVFRQKRLRFCLVIVFRRGQEGLLEVFTINLCVSLVILPVLLFILETKGN